MPDVDYGVVIRHLVDVAAAKTELCVTVSFSLSSGFFRSQSLHGMSAQMIN
jgi:hypothetical protein